MPVIVGGENGTIRVVQLDRGTLEWIAKHPCLAAWADGAPSSLPAGEPDGRRLDKKISGTVIES